MKPILLKKLVKRLSDLASSLTYSFKRIISHANNHKKTIKPLITKNIICYKHTENGKVSQTTTSKNTKQTEDHLDNTPQQHLAKSRLVYHYQPIHYIPHHNKQRCIQCILKTSHKERQCETCTIPIQTIIETYPVLQKC